MSLLKSQKKSAVDAPVGVTPEQQQALEEFNKKALELREFMDKNNLGFMVQHQVIVVPKNKLNV